MTVFRCFVLLVAIFSAPGNLSAAYGDDLERFDAPENWQHDAELTDVFFLNTNLGWAVGGQGAILRTTDGGRTWNGISTLNARASQNLSLSEKLHGLTPVADANNLKPIRCRLESVYFIDANHGWIAGGYEYPYMNRSHGIVLRTRDGGVSWQKVPSLVLPRISKIHFKDRLSGWAVGDKSNLYPTGICYTSDGGQTWTSQSNQRFQDWKDAIAVEDGFVLVDQQGRIAKSTNDELEVSVVIAGNNLGFQQVTSTSPNQLIATGRDGNIAVSNDQGLSWKTIAQAQQLRGFDLRTTTWNGKRCFFAGHPSSKILSYDMTSGVIEASATPSSAPLNSICFVDEQNGWAVGALGTILSTADGGQTWTRQRGEERVAMLTISTSPSELPLEANAKYANEEDYLTANLLVNLAANTAETNGLVQATERLGASYFLETHISPTSDSIEKLVKEIRAAQPNVVITSTPFENQQVIKKAIQIASDPQQYPAHRTLLGLQAWKVDRLAVQDKQGSIKLDRNQLLARSGQLIEDQIAISRALMGMNFQSTRDLKLQIIQWNSSDRRSSKTLFDGLERSGNVVDISVPKRKTVGRRGNLGSIHHVSQKAKTFQQFAAWEIQSPQQALAWRKQIQNWIGFVSPETAGVWVMQLAQAYLEQGQPEQAAMAVELIASRWPKHAFGPASAKWLVHFYGSSELGRATFERSNQLQSVASANQIASTDGVTTVQRNGAATQSVWVPDLLDKAARKAANMDVDESALSFEQRKEKFRKARMQKANIYLSRLRQRDPDLTLGIEYRFLESGLTRRAHGWLPVANLTKQIGKRVDEDSAIAAAAINELDINGEDRQPAAFLSASPTSVRPLLDGKPDDPIWQQAAAQKRFQANLAANAVNVDVDRYSFAYDDEFLYIFASQQKVKGHLYGNKSEPASTEDPDLSRRDRIKISIDADRDYCTQVEFVVDHRGWASESCAGSVGWNPDWYLAQSEDESTWSVEIAIPFEDVFGTAPNPNEYWAVQFQRIDSHSNPMWGVGGDQKTAPTGLLSGLITRPDMFQLLKFEE